MGIAIATLMGLNIAYENLHDADIFTGIVIPEGLDRELLIDRIFHRCGEFSVGHTDWEFMHNEILDFFKVHYSTFDRMWKVLQMEYDPLENYNRIENYGESGNNSNQSSSSNSSTGSGTVTNNRAAENSANYEPYDKSQSSDSASGTSGTSASGSYTTKHNSHIHGNIGVTTSQQMLRSEWEDVAPLNVYETIANYFADEFCIQCY